MGNSLLGQWTVWLLGEYATKGSGSKNLIPSSVSQIPFTHGDSKLRMSADECEDPHPDPHPEIPIEYDPEFGKIADESDLAEPWRELARINVNDEAELRADRIAELRELLEESGIVLQPGDDWQMLMFLRAANCEPKKAFDVVRHFLEYRKYIAKSLPSELRDLMEATKDLYCVLPHRDKVGHA